jgi:hypothetical protein
MILFHGSNRAIDRVDLAKCRPYKDFGRGFYTTLFKEQAQTMAGRTARIYGGTPAITEFTLDDALVNDRSFHIRKFEGPDTEWALFVINNRNEKFQDLSSSEWNGDNKYDIVIGPVANDDLVALFDLYIAGTLSAAALAVEMTYRKLSNQISFHTEKIIPFLKKNGVTHG